MTTLIGSGTNLLVSGTLEDMGARPIFFLSIYFTGISFGIRGVFVCIFYITPFVT